MKACAALAAMLLMTSAATAAVDERCSVPESLTDSQASLSKVSFAVQRRQQLDVLFLSSAPSQTGTAKGLRGYPSFFETALKERLPGVEIRVVVHSAKRRIVMELLPLLPGLLQDTKPNLVIWQGGTAEAYRGIDADGFGNALSKGIAQVVSSGADVILVDMQFSPRTSIFVDAAAYVDNMRRVAEFYDVPFFRRGEIMRYWSDSGAFDFNALRNDGLFEQIHHCIGRLLVEFVLRGASLTNYKGAQQ